MVPQRAARRRLDALTARETVGGVAGVSSTEEDARWSVRRIGVLAGSVALVALVIVGQVVNAGNTAGILTGESAVIAVAFLTMGAMVLVRMPRHLVGRLMLAAGGAASISVLSTSWTTWVVVDWVSQWSWWPAYGLITLALLYFPDGRLPSPRWRSLAVFIVAGTAAAAAAFAVAALDDPRDLINTDNPGVAATGRAQLLVQVGMLAVVATLAGLVAVLVSLFLRWRRADGEARAQLACLLAAGVLLVLGVVLEAMNLTGAWVIMVVALPVGMGLAILRYRLYGLDQVINRTLVWLVMSLLVIAGFVGLITLLRDLLMADDTSNASLVATGLIAVTFEPIRGRVQRGVNRLLYGDRDDPYQVITRLGDLLGRTVEPTAVLPLLTGTIARSLRVPQVAVEVEGREGPRLVAVHGASNNPVESFEMVARGQHVGRLLVANRSATSRFSPVERRLLKDLALQAAVAADAVRLIHDLQDSRERLITAREEERRRLRRELHDGLGPTLAGMAMQVRAAQKLAAEQPRLTRILDALAADLQTCTAEVRQLVSQLRPPALDRGLAAALRHECARFDTATLSVRLEIDGDLQGLPAAIEVAAYRIVAEALTNVTPARPGQYLSRAGPQGPGVDAGDRRRRRRPGTPPPGWGRPRLDAGAGHGARRRLRDRAGRPARNRRTGPAAVSADAGKGARGRVGGTHRPRARGGAGAGRRTGGEGRRRRPASPRADGHRRRLPGPRGGHGPRRRPPCRGRVGGSGGVPPHRCANPPGRRGVPPGRRRVGPAAPSPARRSLRGGRLGRRCRRPDAGRCV
jgi:Signal transduction histidine kinase